MTWQDVGVAVSVGLALAYVVRRFVGRRRRPRPTRRPDVPLRRLVRGSDDRRR